MPLRLHALAGLLAGTTVVAGAVIGGAAFVSHLPGAWFFGTPGGPLGSVSGSTLHPSAVGVVGVYGGLAAMVVVWLRFAGAIRRAPGTPVSSVIRVLGVWIVPFLVAPPLFSRDVYSYAGQGEMVAHHINPYVYGPGVLGATPFNILAGPLWANTPSPYGPAWLSLDGLATSLSHHQVLADLVLLRIVSLVGVVLIAASLPVLARHLRQDPALSVVLGAGSPLVLATLVGGEHNDALMVGLLMVGMALWLRGGAVAGIVVCSLAAGVKVPALLGVAVIGWNWAPGDAGFRRRVASTAGAMGIAACVLAAVSAVSGVGWGWVGALGASGKVSTGVTPVDAVARAVAWVLHQAGSGVSLTGVRTVATAAGFVLAGTVTLWLVWRSPRIGAISALGGSLLVVALFGPVLWAWYVTWGLVVLAPVARTGVRRVVISLTVLEALIGAGSVLSMLRSIASIGIVTDVLVVCGVGAACLLAARLPYVVPERSPWFGHRALQPAGVTATAIQRPHSAQ